MIKVNLLDSVTDRARSVAAVESRVANPRARSWMLAAAVFSVMALGMLFDYVHANYKHAAAGEELKKQEGIAAQVRQINKDKDELEKKIDAVNKRIEAIKRLRASQQGPVAVLSAINERLPTVNDFMLTMVEQKGDTLTIEGNANDEAAVTRFARSLEFSDKLFENVSVETERKLVEPKDTDMEEEKIEIDETAPKPEVVKFKITCKYNQPGVAPAAEAADPAKPAANQVAQK
ncbi:MAG TPA: PilN domain-containing protein [Pyrinomonadaceae bacterium]|nr:PilN domain-containing protein [Pyrinomonadaceae bacterium]